MKTEMNSISSPVNKRKLNELLNEHKETIGEELKFCNSQRSFGLSDLWNIRKRQRTGMSMRRW